MTGVLIKKEKFGYRDRYTQREDDVKTQREKRAMSREPESRVLEGRNSFQFTTVFLVPTTVPGTL